MGCGRCKGTGFIPDHVGLGGPREPCPDCRGGTLPVRADPYPGGSAISWPMVVTLGRHGSVRMARRELVAANVHLGVQVSKVLDRVSFSSTLRTVRVMGVNDRNLGLTSSYLYSSVLSLVNSYGYRVCPAEVGTAVRLAYLGRIDLMVAMSSISERTLGLTHVKVSGVRRPTIYARRTDRRFQPGITWLVMQI